MRTATRNGVFAVAASGALAVTLPTFAAFASDGATANGSAAGSPGLLSGNTVQLPVDVPVNACGNTVNVAGVLNPAVGNRCANTGGSRAAREGAGASTGTSGGAVAEGGQTDSAGVLSGNGVQAPVHVPVNVSGNSVNVVGVGNAATGNESTNTSGGRVDEPRRPGEPAPRPAAPAVPAERAQLEPPANTAPPRAVESLAHTGADATVPALAGGAALVLGGVVLYRRFRPRTDA
ncbi:chaplin [Streptomyces lancefieldiae]|uniref:Chaplin n=1 Tax=Streptomyces lancefieldiae TaxID=3075520 RepID=A0ABU3API1_9ACTN|nr:chaplin [Streptomyces sp. DSM 40712]MDT0611868.1 chaplin [Streptomyces sp. DSM 40712]